MNRAPHAGAARRDLLVAAVALAAIVLWDLAGADLALSRLFADAHGFAWRESWWTSRLLHDGGRHFAWGVFAVLVWKAARPPSPVDRQPWRRVYPWTLIVIVLCVVAAPLLWAQVASAGPVAPAQAAGAAASWRDSAWAAALLHDGGRRIGALLFVLLAVWAWRVRRASATADAPHDAGRPSRADYLQAISIVLLCAVAVPALRRFSSTSCPWDLAEFGGVAAYVPHWLLAVHDGGPGHCFPSGHASAAFAFWPMVLLWRAHDPARARAWGVGILAVGTLFGAAQLVRGAHFASHTLWTAWLCWAVTVGAVHGPRWLRALAAARPARPAPDRAIAPRPVPAAARPGRRDAGR